MVPSAFRSSGMRPIPAAMAWGTSWRGTSCPSISSLPLSGGYSPETNPAKVVCPLPDTPMMPSVSPARRRKLTPWSDAPPLPPSARSTPSSSTLPGVAGGRSGRWTLRPTISSANSSFEVSAVLRSATTRPRRSTTTRSEADMTSCSLWLMKISDSPFSVIWRRVANRLSASCAVSTAVGSSRIRIRASLYSALRISTRWHSPTDRSDTRASGSTFRPNFRDSSTSLARPAARLERNFQSGSVPVRTFSSTVRFGASAKCWCTMPTPARIAARDLPGGRSAPSTRTVPSSAV